MMPRYLILIPGRVLLEVPSRKFYGFRLPTGDCHNLRVIAVVIRYAAASSAGAIAASAFPPIGMISEGGPWPHLLLACNQWKSPGTKV